MKKLISMLLAIVMLFSISAVVFAAEVPQQDYPQRFWDVPKDHWAFNYIVELVNKGVLAGYEDGSFQPDGTVTRAEWAKIMVLAAGLPTNDNNVYFTDMNNHWANIYVNTAKDYLTAYTDGTFKPDQAAVREDVIVSLVKLKGYDISNVDYSYLNKFTDINSILNSLAYAAVAVEKGLIAGLTEKTIGGQDTLTRAEAATLLWRALQYEDDNTVVDTIESSSIQETAKKLRPDPSQAVDETGKRIKFPVEADYKVIEQLLKDEYSYADNIEYTEGIDESGVPLSGAKYLEGSIILNKEDYADMSLYGEVWCAYIRVYDSDEFDDYSHVLLSPIFTDEEWEKHILTQIEYYSTPAETDHEKHGWAGGNELALGLDKYQWFQLEQLRHWIFEYIIKDDMTDIEKIKAIHDYIIKNCAYDKKLYDKMEAVVRGTYNAKDDLELTSNKNSPYGSLIVSPEEDSPYGPLVLKKSLCGGFAAAFQFLMESTEIESMIVHGKATQLGKKFDCEILDAHTWNLVKLDGKWYHIDLTWDNPAKNIPTGQVDYDYFLISDSEMSRKRNWEYSDLYSDEEYPPECTSSIDVGFKR